MSLQWMQRSDHGWYATSTIGAAIVSETDEGDFILDMWRSDQSDIGQGRFTSLVAAQKRAECILDPRANAWEMVVNGVLED